MEELFVGMTWALILPFAIIWFILLLTALISCLKAERTNGPKWIWILVILFINIIGPVLYFVFGRRQD